VSVPKHYSNNSLLQASRARAGQHSNCERSVTKFIVFILWDRRSTLKPIRDELKDLEIKKVDQMLQALQKLAQDDPKLAEILRSFSLL